MHNAAQHSYAVDFDIAKVLVEMGANTAAQTIGQHGLTPAGATPLDIAMRYFQPNLSDNKPWFKEKELAQKATVQLLLDHTQDIEPQILEQLEKWGFSKERAEEA